ncbi:MULTISPECIES: dihydrofolate reductase family protein [unclassified Fusibacter]|uniref:dihydrofolate reductase family protein n=1 Tax=unclassified Fusibacter TaxID=2624464 RepID=UPI00101068DE|nr:MULTISPECIES: dihydrofolate reductase family protein [unclassified Fusibacter]MCK8059152.1 dihydrofolate reductase family protein [Fusibacter sp. A2]NPE22561.1 dihydrofolate reductase [Fusibacter sp. A1]RXV60664.1 dihydrofolate reductase [Fusibacter sp. A1]
MRKIILNLAISLDGYIADLNGGFDWIKGDGDVKCNTEKSFDFLAFMDNVDTVVMGAKAYEDCGIRDVMNYESKRFIVATSRVLTGEKQVEFVNGDICGHVQLLQEQAGKDIWLFGGAGLTDAFIKKNIIDEYIIGIIPILLGSGRRLFLDDNPTIELHLDECTVQEGITILKYTRRN